MQAQCVEIISQSKHVLLPTEYIGQPQYRNVALKESNIPIITTTNRILCLFNIPQNGFFLQSTTNLID